MVLVHGPPRWKGLKVLVGRLCYFRTEPDELFSPVSSLNTKPSHPADIAELRSYLTNMRVVSVLPCNS